MPPTHTHTTSNATMRFAEEHYKSFVIASLSYLAVVSSVYSCHNTLFLSYIKVCVCVCVCVCLECLFETKKQFIFIDIWHQTKITPLQLVHCESLIFCIGRFPLSPFQVPKYMLGMTMRSCFNELTFVLKSSLSASHVTTPLILFGWQRNTHTHTHTHINIYIYIQHLFFWLLFVGLPISLLLFFHLSKTLEMEVSMNCQCPNLVSQDPSNGTTSLRIEYKVACVCRCRSNAIYLLL